MTFNHHRRSIRLINTDYSLSGFYFVTICTTNRECLFGEITKGEMKLNEYGKIIQEEWLKTSEIRKNIIIDEFVIMPNHIHMIILITEQSISRRGVLHTPNTTNHTIISEHPFQSPSQTIGAIIRGFKGSTTKRINQLREIIGTVWQRNYYEHIIRNNTSLEDIRLYIKNNPMKWFEDQNNPMYLK